MWFGLFVGGFAWLFSSFWWCGRPPPPLGGAAVRLCFGMVLRLLTSFLLGGTAFTLSPCEWCYFSPSSYCMVLLSSTSICVVLPFPFLIEVNEIKWPPKLNLTKRNESVV